jgi:hypothetical protein
MTHIKFQTVLLQDVMHLSHYATFCLCSSASPVLQMLYGISTVGLCHYKITIAERSLTTQSNQHRGTERDQLSFVARRKTAFRHLGYFMDAPSRPKPASERRDAAHMIKGSIGEYG